MIRRRKRRPIDASNHDRWMISYADFITLLFAFFVVMYSISAVNDEKYKAFSDSLEAAFYEKKQTIDGNEPLQLTSKSSGMIPVSDGSLRVFDLAEERERMRLVSEQLSLSLKSFVDEKKVSIHRNNYWIELELNSEIFFKSGESELAESSIPVIKKIAELIKPLPNPINVEGHTDNVPIKTLQFPSNWELSSARATRVVQEFIKAGIDPNRLSAIGYGENHPIADNKNEDGRFKNRRVVLLLISKAFSRYGTSDKDRDTLLKQMPVVGMNTKNP